MRGSLALVGLAVLASAGPAQAVGEPANRLNYTRTSAFEYRSDGLLTVEVVEPGLASTGQCAKTSYGYDDQGNRISSTVGHCAGTLAGTEITSRTASQNWQTDLPAVTVGGVAMTQVLGAYPVTAQNALAHVNLQSFDPRFGVPLTTTDPNNRKVTTTLDVVGRKIREDRTPGGFSTIWRYCQLSGRSLDPDGSDHADCAGILSTLAPGEAPADAVHVIHSEPRLVAGDAKNGPWTRQYVDRAGRVIRTATEGFDAATQPADIRQGVIVADTVYSRFGPKELVTQPYWLARGSSRNKTAITGTIGTNDVSVVRTAYDFLGRPIVVDTADDEGRQKNVVFGEGTFAGYGAYGKSSAARTRYAYDGLNTTAQDDKDFTRTEEKTPTGEVWRVRDPDGAEVINLYDAFGNLYRQRDPLGNDIWTGFDIRGRRTTANERDSGYWTYTYDAIGQLKTQQHARQLAAGKVTSLSYDVGGRILTRTEDEFTTTYFYDTFKADALGNRAACTSNAATVTSRGQLCQVVTSHGVQRRWRYDDKGRVTQLRADALDSNGVATTAMAQTMTYDSKGRVDVKTYPNKVAVKHQYTALGYPLSVTLNTTATINARHEGPGDPDPPPVSWPAQKVLWQAQQMNAWGRVEREGSGDPAESTTVSTRPVYHPTGRVIALTAGLGDGTGIVSQSYNYDSLGRMRNRTDFNGDLSGADGVRDAVTEQFEYDQVSRLIRYAAAHPNIPTGNRAVDLIYNALGMVLYRSDLGSYAYPAAGTTTRPHAVTSMTPLSGAAVSYSYDATGNLLTASGGKYRSLNYTSFNLPDGNTGAQGPAGNPKYQWTYDESHARFKEVHTLDASAGAKAGTRTTWYMHPDNAGGLGFEFEDNVRVNGDPVYNRKSNRDYITAGGRTVAVLVTEGVLPTLPADQLWPGSLPNGATLVKVENWHVDLQGSLLATSDHTGTVTERYSYDPFGQRRYTSGKADKPQALEYDWNPAINHETDRGYTGHEHLDDIGIIHMNGRLFDPRLGRFIQPDPLMQDVLNLQNYDKYSYCFGNPMGCTDPTGQSFFLTNIWKKVWHSTVGKVVVIAAVSYFTAGAGSAWAATAFDVSATSGIAAVAGGAAAGFSTSLMLTNGDLEAAFKGGLTGAFTAGVFYGVGNALQGAEWTPQGVGLHAVAGCVTSVAGGGKCGPGALSAAFSQAALPLKQGASGLGGTIISAVIGGTASKLGGGTFASGAQTAAFGYLFNELMHQGPRREAMQRAGYADMGDSSPPEPGLEGVYPEALLLGGPIGRGVAGAFEALTTTTLYRAVGEAEMADILATGGFRNALGLESKYFSSTLEGAQKYADMASRAFGDVMTIVKTRIPTSWITNTMRVEVDGGVPAVVVPTARLPGLRPPVVVKPGG